MTPPLPKPVHHEMHDGQCVGYFSEAQLLAYRAEVIEMCAAVCEAGDDGFREDAVDRLWGAAVNSCAKELRTLK
jgi:hypothetical protein